MESSAHTISNINKELDNEREKEKQWEEKAEEIMKQSENQLTQMVQEVHKENKTITTYENNFFESNQKIKNLVKLIKEKMWGKVVANTDRLCDWFELHQSLCDVCGSIKE